MFACANKRWGRGNLKEILRPDIFIGPQNDRRMHTNNCQKHHKKMKIWQRLYELKSVLIPVRRLFGGCVNLWFLISVFGCAPGRETPEEIKIGVSVATMQEAVYSFMKKAMVDYIKKDKVELIWVQADNKKERQYEQIDTLISQGIDVLILHPVDTETARDLVEKAEKARIPVVAMDRLPSGAKVACYVTADSFEVGRIQAQHLADRIGGKGNLIILKGDEGNNVAEEITKSNLSVFSKYSEIKVLTIKSHKFWSRSLARQTVNNALKKHRGNIQGIICNNSGMAMGALEALRGKGLIGKIVVIGADADLDACRLIIKRELSADVDKMPYEIGLASIKTAVAIVRKKSFPADRIINNRGVKVKVRLTPIKLITTDNIEYMKYRWPDLGTRLKSGLQ